jgi:predicted GNAT family N-acyltransferase
MIKITSFNIDDKELCDIAFNIRTEVFVKEQKVPHNLEYDGTDNEAQHYLLYYNEKPVATARWRITEKGIKFERFAVLKDYRDKGLGGKLVRKALEDTLKLRNENGELRMENGKKKMEIYLHSQIAAVRFYERHGFVKEGEMFKEAGIEHYRMVYKAKTFRTTAV